MPVLSPTTARPRVGSTRHRRSNPLVLWHLLSLDAPTVAALWTAFIALSVGIRLPLTTILAMAVAVWMLYAADRLLDARHLVANPLHTRDLELRHRFHHRHRLAFNLGIVGASVVLAILIPRLNPDAIHLDLILGALLAGYFLLIHVTGSAHRLPKELAVGLFFAAAVFIPTIARAPSLRLTLLPAALVFALLCTLNCLFIYHWEHPTPSPTTPEGAAPHTEITSTSHTTPHPATRLALRYLPAIAVTCLLATLLLAAFDPHSPRPLTAACTTSSALLLLLHRNRHHLSPTTLRATADLALLTPLPLLLTLRP